MCSKQSAGQGFSAIVCSTHLCIARPKDGVKHYLYSLSRMKYPVAAELLRLPGICDGSIQEAWSHDCPVGLSFRGLFPNPRKPNRAHKLGVACQRIRQGGGAEPLLNRLLQLRPGDPTGHAMLAVLEYRQGNCAAATPHFEKAGELLDSQLEALHAYATCLVKLKRLDDAVTVFQRAVALHADDRQERQLLASVQLTVHKPQDALATLGPLLEAGNPRADTLELASNAYEDSGDTPQAVSTLRQALLLDPRNVSLYLDFANISFAHESFQVGIDVITEGMVMQPNAGELYVARGVLYVQLAQYDKAEADFEKAYELDPNQSLSSAAQGLAAVQANDLDHALASIQSKLARKPN